MGCFNSKAKARKLKKSSKQSMMAKKKRMAPNRKISSQPRTPTKSMRSDKNNPESLKSYEPSDDEETIIEMKKERQRLLRQLDLRMQASDKSASTSQTVSTTGCSTEGSSSNSTQPTASQAKMECHRMPPQLQEEIKSASSSMQSRQMESLGGEKPIQVNAQLYRSSVPSSQQETNPPPPLLVEDPVVVENKSAAEGNVPRMMSLEKHPSAGPPSSSLDAPPEKSGKLERPPSLLMAREMPQIDKPTEGAGPIPRLTSFRNPLLAASPTNQAPFPVPPELPPFPGGVKSRKSCSSLPHSFSTKPTRALSLTNYTRPPAFGETSPNKGLSFGGPANRSLTNIARPPAFGETSPKSRSSSGGGTPLSRGSLTNVPRPLAFGETSPQSGSGGGSGSLPRQTSLTFRPPFGANLLPTPQTGPPQPPKAVAANTLLPPPPTFPKGTTFPPASEMTNLPPGAAALPPAAAGTTLPPPSPTSGTLPGEASPKH